MQDLFIGFTSVTWGDAAMYAIGIVLIVLAIKKEYEPMLLLPIGFGAILANLPLNVVVEHNGQLGFLGTLFQSGIQNELFPILIFIAIGAMIDFGPLFKNPFMIFFGAAAQLGIFVTIIAAYAIFSATRPGEGAQNLRDAASIGIIGAADGPTAIYVSKIFSPKLLGPISVAAYSYMSLVPIIQPPVIKLLTTKHERRIRMEPHEGRSPALLRIGFPIVVALVAGFAAPISVPLVGSLMFGNLLRESGVTERISKAAQNELANLVTLLLGITIGSTMTSDAFLQWETLVILGLGLVAFVFDTAGGVLFAKCINLFLKKKVNPMIGACGISAFPMSARVIQRMAQDAEPGNIILMPAVSANVSGQLGSIFAGGLVLALVPMLLGL